MLSLKLYREISLHGRQILIISSVIWILTANIIRNIHIAQAHSKRDMVINRIIIKSAYTKSDSDNP